MIDFTVNDMTCGHCASTIARAVKSVDASSACEVDLASRKVSIRSALPAAGFAEAIREAGYTPVERAP